MRRDQPGSFTWGLGHAAVARKPPRPPTPMDARRCTATRSQPDFRGLEGYEDHDVGSLFFWNDAGKLIAVAVDLSWPLPCRHNRALFAQKSISDFYAGRVGQQQFKGCDIYQDFRELLAHKDIDAVWGCMPDHWHDVIYSRAIEAGKDIYGEKPLTRWIAEGIKVRDAVRPLRMRLSDGYVSAKLAAVRQACELAINGYLGKVHTIQVGAQGGTSYPAEPPSNPPEGFDYNMWKAGRPYHPVQTRNKSSGWPIGFREEQLPRRSCLG